MAVPSAKVELLLGCNSFFLILVIYNYILLKKSHVRCDFITVLGVGLKSTMININMKNELSRNLKILTSMKFKIMKFCFARIS